MYYDTMERANVYFTRKITPEGLTTVYKSLGIELEGKVAIKMCIGERGSKSYLKDTLIAPFVRSFTGTIVDCNVVARGSRNKADEHMRTAIDHGFTKFAAVDILDAEGEIKITVNNGKHLKTCMLGSHFSNYTSYLNLSHVTGDAVCGFGAALENQSIGFASRNGEAYIRSAGQTTNPMMLMFKKADQIDVIESVAEAAKATSDYIKEHEKDILYIAVMNNITLDNDGDKNQAAPIMHDIGILGSTDPVALDQAVLDLIWCSQDPGARFLKERIDEKKGRHITEYAEALGLGSRAYDLVDIDNNKTITQKTDDDEGDQEVDEHSQFGEGLIQKAEDVKIF